jgi:hypothetical protein
MKSEYEYHIETKFIQRDSAIDYSKEDAINALTMAADSQVYGIFDDARGSYRDASFEFVSHSLTPVKGGFVLSILGRTKRTE